MAFIGKHGLIRFRALFNSGAWLLIGIGLLLFTMRIPLSNEGFITLPVAVTVFQTAGLVFCLFGFQIMASLIVWPSINLGELVKQSTQGNVAAAMVVLGLMIFNGLSIIAFVLWLAGALGAGVTPK
jgi:hypothetical protein